MKNLHSRQRFATLTPAFRQPAALLAHFPEEHRETAFGYPTPPTAYSRRAARSLKPLPIALLAALLAAGIAPQAWADSGGTTTILSGYYIGVNGASGNNVIVTTSKHTYGSASGGYSRTEDVTGNTLTIESGGEVSSSTYGGYVSQSSGIASDNTLIIRGKVGYRAYGGYSERGSATDNKVFIEGGATSSLYGGIVNSIDSIGAATGNSVTINSGTVGGQVLGGQTFGGGNATGNTITFAGGTVEGSVRGGYCNRSCSDMVSNNTLNVQAKVVCGRRRRQL